MPKINDVHIPDDVDVQIQRLVDEGEFMNYDEAIKELISTGLTAYRTSGGNGGGSSEFDEFDEPAEPPGHDDEYVF